MDLKLFLSTFGLVFLGAAGALVLTSAIAVLVGEGLARLIPPLWIQRAAGAAFIVMGLLFVLGKAPS